MARRRIDVHHHVLPPFYAAWTREKGLHETSGRDLPEWSVEGALAVMDRYEIERAILSVSTPGVHADASEASLREGRALARRLNEFNARLVSDRRERFGFYAQLTLPDVAGALAEATHALDSLAANGVVLLANSLGEYLGEPHHDELFAELNRRSAVVLVHPSFLPGPRVPGVPPFAADFLLDTTRAAYRLVHAGFVRRYPQLRIILSHAGGFVPYASHRLAVALAAGGVSPAQALDELRSFYFDTALSGSAAALPSLLAFAKPGRVLFGSDWPFAPAPVVAHFTSQLDAYPGLDAAGHAAINHENALALFAARG
jgi:predicted TIM-barrel fold metal-dependent hydrolase